MTNKRPFSSLLLAVFLFSLLGITAFFQITWAIRTFEVEKIRLEETLSKSLAQMFMNATKEMYLLPNAVLNYNDSFENFDEAFNDNYAFWKKQSLFSDLFSSVYLYDSNSTDTFTEWSETSFVPVIDDSIEENLRRHIEGYNERLFTSLTPFHTVLENKTMLLIDPLVLNQTPINGHMRCLVYVIDYSVFTEQFLPYFIGNEIEKDTAYYYFIYNVKTDKVVSTNHPDLNKETFNEFDFILPLLPDNEVSTNHPARFLRESAKNQTGFSNEQLPHIVRTFLFPYDTSEGMFSQSLDKKKIEKNTLILALDHKEGSMLNATVKHIAQSLRTSLIVLIILSIGIMVLIINMRKAQSLARRQQEFISTITHELKTPLAVISSAAQNLADGIVTDSERVKKYGKIIQKEDKRLHSSIEYFLTYSNLNTSKKLKKKQTDFSTLIDTVLGRTQHLFVENDFTVEKNIPNEQVLIECDSAAMLSVIQNLVTNVLKHAKSGKFLGVSLSTEEIVEKKRGFRASKSITKSIAVLRVIDHGRGIPKSEQKTIFEAFSRGRFAVDMQVEGSGIGLNVAKRIVTLHGGSLEVETSNQFGTIFKMIMPIQEEFYESFEDRGV